MVFELFAQLMTLSVLHDKDNACNISTVAMNDGICVCVHVYMLSQLRSQIMAADQTGEPCWSLVAHNVDEVEKFFKETIENRLAFLCISFGS